MLFHLIVDQLHFSEAGATLLANKVVSQIKTSLRIERRYL
jgi:lysophospholipase L1-like esterase